MADPPTRPSPLPPRPYCSLLSPAALLSMCQSERPLASSGSASPFSIVWIVHPGRSRCTQRASSANEFGLEEGCISTHRGCLLPRALLPPKQGTGCSSSAAFLQELAAAGGPWLAGWLVGWLVGWSPKHFRNALR